MRLVCLICRCPDLSSVYFFSLANGRMWVHTAVLLSGTPGVWCNEVGVNSAWLVTIGVEGWKRPFFAVFKMQKEPAAGAAAGSFVFGAG